MKNNQSALQNILRIKKDNAVLLSAVDSEEELMPLESENIIRALSGNAISAGGKPNTKLKYIVRTNYPPDIALLKIGEIYDIQPTILKTEVKMILTNFKISNSKSFKWNFEFEEA